MSLIDLLADKNTEYIKEADLISVVRKSPIDTQTNLEAEKKELEALLNLPDKQITLLQSYCQFGNPNPPKIAMQARINKINDIINNCK